MRFLIIGGTGSLGKKLIDRLLPMNHVAVMSRDEAKHFTIRQTLKNSKVSQHSNNLDFFVGDIRDERRILNVINQYEPNVVIIAAALKQVDTCEISPDESLLTNVLGTQNVINAVQAAKRCPNVLFVSTDKSCAPVNSYGMCKALSERLITSQFTRSLSAKFLCVRYGNVLESRGSIIPLFRYQALNSQYLTVTHPDMTRFVMTLDNSVDLILHTLAHGSSGETWIPKIPAMRIGDLAEIFSEISKKSIRLIGLRPGEKMHEDLINSSESVRTSLSPDRQHYVISPALIAGNGPPFTYSSSDDVMSKHQLFEHLTKLKILDASLESFVGRNIEEIVA